MNFADDKYLPMELWTEIMARLPVKSLLRFRCVCKTWCSLIDSPNFMSKHVECYNKNHGKTLILTKEDVDPASDIDRGCKFGLLHNYSFEIYVDNLYTSLTCYEYIGGCKGLMLWCQNLFDDDNTRLRLWNPCTRKSLILPPNPWNSTKAPLFERKYGIHLVGFAASSNDYKVVEFNTSDIDYKLSNSNSNTWSVVVYSVNDHSWRLKNINTANFPLELYFLLHRRGYVFLQGATYWIAGELCTPSTETHVVYFNFDVEEFGFVELPDAGKEMIARLIFILGDSIAVLSISSKSTNVWVMDCEKESWRLWSSGAAYSDPNEVIQSDWWEDIDSELLYDNNTCTLLLGISDMIYSYDIKNQQSQPITRRSDTSMFYSYEESLVLHKGSQAQTLIPLP